MRSPVRLSILTGLCHAREHPKEPMSMNTFTAITDEMESLYDIQPPLLEPLLEPVARDSRFSKMLWWKKKKITPPLREETLLAFSANGRPFSGGAIGRKESYELTFGDATMNVLVLGGTGSGKTASIMKPALYRLMQKGCAGLVLDVKGDYVNLLRQYFPESTHIIGMSDDAEPINLISGYNTDKFRTLLSELAQAGNDGSNTGYFTMQGIVDALLVFEFIQYVEGKSPTLASIYQHLAEPKFFMDKVRKDVFENPNLTAPASFFSSLSTRISSTQFSVLHVGGLNGTPSERQLEQYSWNVGKLMGQLAPFYNDERVCRQLCATDALPIEDIIYKRRQTIVLDMNITRYGETALTVSKMLRQNFRDTVIGRGESALDREGVGKEFFTFNMVDEYQEFLSTESVGAANDVNWFDRSRSFGHINIISTQAISSMASKSKNRHAIDTIVQNCRNIVCLATTDEATLNLVKTLAVNGNQGRQHLHSALGLGFLYAGNSHRNGNRTLCANIKTGPVQKYPHMGIAIGAGPGRPNFGSFDARMMQVAHIKNPLTQETTEGYQRLTPEEVYQINNATLTALKGKNRPKIVLVRSMLRSTRGSEDFLAIMKGYHVLEMRYSGAASLVKVLNALEKVLQPHSIVAMVSGGGDTSGVAFDVYKNADVVTAADRLKKRCVRLVTGIGHAADAFPIEQVAFVAGITPTDAAYNIKKILENDNRAWSEAQVLLARRNVFVAFEAFKGHSRGTRK